MRKYELTDIVLPGTNLRRIRRLANGEIGGYISDEHNLSHDGNAWVSGDARVFGDAWVSGNAWLRGNAQLDTVVKMATRSDGHTFTVFPCADGIWRLTAGCRFFTLEEAWQHWEWARAGTALGEETFDILVLFEHHIERNGGHK